MRYMQIYVAAIDPKICSCLFSGYSCDNHPKESSRHNETVDLITTACVESVTTLLLEGNRFITSKGVTASNFRRVYEWTRADWFTHMEILRQKCSRYTNPYRHLIRCDSSKKELFIAVRLSEDGLAIINYPNSTSTAFSSPIGATEKEKGLRAYPQLIALCNQTVTVVEDNKFHNFSKYTGNYSIRALRKVPFHSVELIENKITEEGAITYHSWPDLGTNYRATFTGSPSTQSWLLHEHITEPFDSCPSFPDQRFRSYRISAKYY